MTPKEEHINRIIKENKYNDYLEIGYGTGHNFKRIKCRSKRAVEPEKFIRQGKDEVVNVTSDQFFDEINDETWDCIFIDGLHTSEQVRKDIINAMKCLSKEGCIILHDVIPHSKDMQIVPRKQREWTGDVWRAAAGFHATYPDVKFETYRSDYGLTVIHPEGKKVRKYFEDMNMTYEEFKANEVELLNIID